MGVKIKTTGEVDTDVVVSYLVSLHCNSNNNPQEPDQYSNHGCIAW